MTSVRTLSLVLSHGKIYISRRLNYWQLINTLYPPPLAPHVSLPIPPTTCHYSPIYVSYVEWVETTVLWKNVLHTSIKLLLLNISMIFICDIIIYPLIKKNKFNCVFLSLNIVIVSKNLKSLQTMCLYRTKKSTNILGVSVLGAGPVGTRPDRLKPVGTRSD